MTSDQLRAALAALSLSQTAAASVLGVTPRAVRLWLAGDRPVPAYVALHLDALAKLRPDALDAAYNEGFKAGMG